MNMIKQA